MRIFNNCTTIYTDVAYFPLDVSIVVCHSIIWTRQWKLKFCVKRFISALLRRINPFPHTTNMQQTILKTSNKIWKLVIDESLINGIEFKILWHNEKLLHISNVSFCHKGFKSCLLQMPRNKSASWKGWNRQRLNNIYLLTVLTTYLALVSRC